MRQVIDRAWTMLTVSQRMANDLGTLFPQARIQIAHNGVHLPPPELQLTPRPDALKNKVILLTCALFAERKGIPVLIEAFDRVADRYPHAILRIIGSGPAEAEIQATVVAIDSSSRNSTRRQEAAFGSVARNAVGRLLCFSRLG
jgi:glycosyltransferase involved in cell wall biosynthesis